MRPIFNEADAIGRYLLGKAPTPREMELYARAQEAMQICPNPYEQSLLRMVIRSPLMAGLIDGGLALSDPTSMIRKKIFIMLAILEASPEHCRRFLPEERASTGFMAITARMIWAGFKGGLGLLLLALLRLKWSLRK